MWMKEHGAHSGKRVDQSTEATFISAFKNGLATNNSTLSARCYEIKSTDAKWWEPGTAGVWRVHGFRLKHAKKNMTVTFKNFTSFKIKYKNLQRHSELFKNYGDIISLFISTCFLESAFPHVLLPSSGGASVYLSRWMSVCVSPRSSSWRVDSWAMWGKVFSSFSQDISSRLGTTNHTLYKEPILRFPDMLTTPPWTYMHPAWRRKFEGGVKDL